MEFNTIQEAQEYFVDKLEYCGTPITEDNFDNIFELWLEREEIIIKENN